MRVLKLGASLVSLWSALNFLVAAAVTWVTLTRGTPPALLLMMTEAEAHALDSRALGVVNAQAAIANPLIMAVCAFVLVLTWRCVAQRQVWALWTLVGILVPVQAFGFVSDAFLGGRNALANGVSSAILLSGLGLCALGLRSNART